MRHLDISRRRFLLAIGATAGVVALEACSAAPIAAPASSTVAAPASAAPAVAAPVAPATARPVFAMTGLSANVAIRPEIGNTLLGMHPKLGRYKDGGIDAKFIGADGGLHGLRMVQNEQATTAMANHDAIFGLASKGEDPGVTMYFHFGYSPISRVEVNPGSPITTLAQLKGKQIGTALGRTALTFTSTVLKNLSIDPPKDLTFVSTPGAAGDQALKDGKIDALASFDTDFASLQAIFGFSMIFLMWPDYVGKLHAGSSLLASNDLIRDNPAIVAAMGRVSAKGTLFMTANPTASINLFWDLFPEAAPKGIPLAEATKQLVPGITERVKLMFPAGRPQELGYFEPEAWKAYTDFAGCPQLDPSKYYTNKFMADINKFDYDAITKLAKTFYGIVGLTARCRQARGAGGMRANVLACHRHADNSGRRPKPNGSDQKIARGVTGELLPPA